MPRIGVCCPEDVTLLGGLHHTHYIKSQSFKIANDEAVVTKWSIDKMGHVALPL